MFGELEKTCKSIGNTKAHINFITRCLKSRLVPKGFLSKPRIHTSKAQQLEQRFARIRMTEQRQHSYSKLASLEKIEVTPLIEFTQIYSNSNSAWVATASLA